MAERRLGITLPLDSVALREQGAAAAQAEALGYVDAWTGEVDTYDGFTPLAVAALSTTTMRLGTGVVNPFTRGVGNLAISAAALAALAPGRFCLGIGSSSDVIVERWNSGSFTKPLSRVRDATAILRAALAGERVEASLDTLSVSGLRLANPPTTAVPIFLAALRPPMLRLAGEKADGVLLNWIGPNDIEKARAEVESAAVSAGREDIPEVACRVFVIPGDAEAAEVAARRFTAAYLTVPVYFEYQTWLGRGDALRPMVEAWRARDRKTAVELVPAEVLDELLLCRGTDHAAPTIERYFAAGVDTVMIHVLPTAEDEEARRAQVFDVISGLAGAGMQRTAADGPTT